MRVLIGILMMSIALGEMFTQACGWFALGAGLIIHKIVEG